MRILLDMDGVIADFNGRLLEIYNHFTNEGVKVEDIKSHNTSKYVGDPYLIRKIIDSVGFIRSLEPTKDSVQSIKMLVDDGHDIAFVSNATNGPTSGHEKREWLNYHFKGIWKIPPLVLTYYKHLVRGDCLVDDNEKNFKNLHPTTTALLWHQPYNADVTGFTRIYDWSHLINWVIDNEQTR